MQTPQSTPQDEYNPPVTFEMLGRLTVEFNAMVQDLHRLTWRAIPVDPDTGILLTGHYSFQELVDFMKKLAGARHVARGLREELTAISSLALSTFNRREQIMRSLYWSDERVGYLAPNTAHPLRLKTVVDVVRVTADVIESFISECRQIRSFVWQTLIRTTRGGPELDMAASAVPQ